MSNSTKSRVTLAIDELEAAVGKVRTARANRKATAGEEKLSEAVAAAHPVRVHAYALTVAEGTASERARMSVLLSDRRLLRRG